MDKPKRWVEKCNFKLPSPFTFNYKIAIFNPIFGFIHILPKFGLKQPSIFSVYAAFSCFQLQTFIDVKYNCKTKQLFFSNPITTLYIILYMSLALFFLKGSRLQKHPVVL